MKRIFLIVFVSGVAFLQACKDDEDTCTKEISAERLAAVDQDRLAIDMQKIDDYLTANNITGVQYAPAESNGVRYVITELGTGAKVSCLESRIAVAYTGRLLVLPTGSFDSSAGITFPLNGVILGWQILFPLIPAGSKFTMYIPSGYAYGKAGYGNGAIPSNANLIFEVELIAAN